MPLPRWLARFNRRVTNRAAVRGAVKEIGDVPELSWRYATDTTGKSSSRGFRGFVEAGSPQPKAIP
jgi:hypothetical protein